MLQVVWSAFGIFSTNFDNGDEQFLNGTTVATRRHLEGEGDDSAAADDDHDQLERAAFAGLFISGLLLAAISIEEVPDGHGANAQISFASPFDEQPVVPQIVGQIEQPVQQQIDRDE